MLERCESGRIGLTANELYRKVPWVQIPPSPLTEFSFSILLGMKKFLICKGDKDSKTDRFSTTVKLSYIV